MLKHHLKLIAILITIGLILAISGCGPSQESNPPNKDRAPSLQIIQPGDPDLAAKAEKYIPKVIEACPGLKLYSADFSAITVEKSSMRDYEDGIELQFQVVQSPKVLPPPLNIRCAQNNCYITINKDGTSVYIAKRACHSICTGTWQENSPGLMGREYPLK